VAQLAQRIGQSVRVIELAGSPAQMGEAFGEATRDEVAALYELRLRATLEQVTRYAGRRAQESELLALASACVAPWQGYDPDGLDELRGIARGSGVALERVIALAGYTDLRDALALGVAGRARRGAGAALPGPDDGGCSAFLAQRDATADARIWFGQTWDLATDNAPFVRLVRRRPIGEPAAFCITTVGCLPLIGLSELGVAVGTTNLRTHDARAGVPYVGVICRALRARSAHEAAGEVRRAPRAGGHTFLLADSRVALALECSARTCAAFRVVGGVHVHTNHVLAEPHRAREADTPRASSEFRLERLSQLLEAGRGRIGPGFAKRCFADAAGGPLAICRDDFDGISTHAAFVACPETGIAEACAGLPSRARWIPANVPHTAILRGAHG
jgi:isopenicillin-N N-acyltransferase-like protein